MSHNAQLSVGPRPPGGPGITRFATRDGHRLSYESSGDSGGAPVLALHDLLVDRGQLRPAAAALTDSGFRLTLPDARGHGASPMISGQNYSVQQLAADALAVLDAEGLATVQIVAFGWGAATALRLATLVPERVVSLALVAPYLPALLHDHPNDDAKRYGEALMEAIAEAATAAAKGQTDHALDLFLEIRWGADWRERLSKPRLAAIRRAAANLGPLLTGMAPEHLERDALLTIERPLTLLLRQDAPAFERWNAEALALLIPGTGMQTATIPEVDEGRAIMSTAWAPVLTRVLTTPGV
jgi:pimeloyl-ACP methyl ester carboxylesterase